MLLGPSPGCCRALQSRTNAPIEAVWVTDDVLSRTFQRYLDVSRSRKRALSSAPGPLYHRKRFGRRRVTELNSFQSLGSLPAWALPNTPDLTNWQWQPPKAGLWAPPPPPPLPPPVANHIDFHVGNKSRVWSPLNRELRDLHVARFKTAAEYRASFECWSRTFAEVVSKGDMSGPATADLCMAANRQIRIARLVFPELHALYGYFLSVVVACIQAAQEKDASFCIPKPRFWRILSEQLSRLEIDTFITKHFIFAMQNTHFRNRRRVLDIEFLHLNRFFELWRGAELHGEPQFWDWAKISEASHLASICSGRVEKLFTTIQSNLAKGHYLTARINLDKAKRLVSRVERFTLKKAALMSDDEQLTQALAEALERKDPSHHHVFYAQATRLLGKTEGWSRAHYNWLQVLARLPKVRTPRFKRLLELFPRRGHAALSHTEICHLLLLHWASQERLQDSAKTRHLWEKIQGQKSHTALAALALAVNKTNPPEQCTAVFWDFWSILRARTGTRTLLRQLALLSGQQKFSPKFLKRLGWTSNDSRVALLIQQILSRNRGERLKFWWPFWGKFSGQISKQWKWPLVNPLLVAKKFNAPYSDRQQGKQYTGALLDRELEQDYRQQLQVVEQETPDEHIASYCPTTPDEKTKHWVLQVRRLLSSLNLLRHAPQITDRQALHYVTIFTSLLAQKQGCLSARDLATLTTVIMRTLDKGQPGSVHRFRWYLGIIYQHLGEKVSTQVGMILKRRRQENWRLWQMRLTVIRTKLQLPDNRPSRNLRGLTRSTAGGMSRLWSLYLYDGRRRTMKRRRLVRLEQLSPEMNQQVENRVVNPRNGSLGDASACRS